MDKIKILEEIKKTYAYESDGLKKLKKLKLISSLIYCVVMLFAFQLQIFNYEQLIFIFLFVFVSTFVLYFYAVYDSSIRTYHIVQEILDFEKLDKILNDVDKKSNKEKK